MNSEAGPCLYDPRFNPRGLSAASSKLVRYWLRCKYSKLHVVCTQLCGCSKATLTAASTVTRLC